LLAVLEKKNADQRTSTADLWFSRLYEAKELVTKTIKTLEKETAIGILRSRLRAALFDPKRGLLSLTGRTRLELRETWAGQIFSLIFSPGLFLRNNVVLTGESGVGKTKAAAVYGFVLAQLGVLAHAEFRDIPPSAFASPLKDGPILETQRILLDNLERVILVDEAYTLADAKYPDVINTFVTMMEQLQGNITVIFAGYPNAIRNLFAVNSGLRSRFSNFYELKADAPNDLANRMIDRLETELLVMNDFQGKPLLQEKDLGHNVLFDPASFKAQFQAKFEEKKDDGSPYNARDVEIFAKIFVEYMIQLLLSNLDQRGKIHIPIEMIDTIFDTYAENIQVVAVRRGGSSIGNGGHGGKGGHDGNGSPTTAVQVNSWI
jgi:hypothetical protein